MRLTAPELAMAAGLTGGIAEALARLSRALEVFGSEFPSGAEWLQIERAVTGGAGGKVAFMAKPTQRAEDLFTALKALGLNEDGVELAAGEQEAVEFLRRAVKVHAEMQAGSAADVNAAGGLETCFQCGRPTVAAVGLDELVRRAAAHVDALKVTAESEERGRAKGLQAVICYPSGKVSVVFHWGARAFLSWSEATDFYK